MRPLYIEGKNETWVELDEPALKISVPQQADQLFPFQRISRIIVIGCVQWRTNALLACAEQGITVTFLDDDGKITGRLLGKNSERQLFLQRLDDLISRPDGKDLYDSWFHAMERMVVQSAAKSLLKQAHALVSTHELLAFLSEQQKNLAVQPHRPIYDTVHGLLAAQVIELFYAAGLAAESELLQEAWLDLPADFTQLLMWDLQVPLLVWLESQVKTPDYRQQIEFYNSRSERINRLFHGLTHKLHRWLVELY